MKKKVEQLARDILTEPVRIVVGALGDSNSDIKQSVEVFQEESMKYPWLGARIQVLISSSDLFTRDLFLREVF